MSTATKEPKKRVREVFSRDELPHIWAHQKAPRGRAKSTSMFFEGATIYSYGSHFPMGRLILDKKGVPAAVMLTTRSYSNTTRRHQSDVRSAVSHLTRFYVTDVTKTRHADNLKDYKARIAAKAEEVTRAKSATLDHLDRLRQLVTEAQRYSEFFKLQTRLTYPDGFDYAAHRVRGEEEKRKADERAAAREERERAKRAEERARAKAEFERTKPEYLAAVAKWVSGELASFPDLPSAVSRFDWRVADDLKREIGVRLRVRNSRIETSMGAVFNVASALPVLAACRLDRAGTVVREDMEVDGYRGVRIDYDAKTVSVGCHTVKFEEAERVAKQLGL